MWRKIGLAFLIATLLFGTLGMIGWIGFHERIRLTLKAVEKEEQAKEGQNQTEKTETPLPDEDFSRIETHEEAGRAMRHLEGLIRTLETDNLPSE